MADYNLKAEITADASGFEAGIKKAQKASKNLSKSVSSMVQGLGKNGLVGALGAVGLATGGVTAIIGTAKKAFQAISKTVNECAEAYRNQYKAEVALETAVKNNPYIDGSSLNSLKQFAGEMQKVSEIGDEQFLPMMAQLIATGRTEAETMDIIRVATDMSATGTMSFETAIQQLNATLNGNIGRLGQQNSELKNLTEEELKSGKAVEILGNKFKGLAEATADTSKQLKNALGDLKENLGRIFETALAPMRKFFTEVINNLNDVLKKSADVKKAMKDVFSEENINIEAPTDSLQIALDEVLKKQREVTANYSQYIQLYGKYIDQTTDETVKAYKEQISDLNRQIKALSEELVKRRKESDAQAKARKEAEANAEEEKQINDLKEKYLKLIAEQEAKWSNIKKVTGEAVKNEERLKFYQEQLVAIMTESGGKITENNQYYKDQMAIIQGILAEIGNPEKQTEWANKLLDQRIEMLETERDRAIQNAEEEGQESYSIWRDYNEKILELKLERLEKEKEKALEEDGLTAEDKIKIEEYYSGETKKIYNELGDYKKKKGKEEEKDEKSKFAVMVEYAKQYAQKIKSIISKVVSTIKNVISGGISLFQKLFEIDPNEILNNVLKIEDKILTFFVDTLPKMPSLISSIVESIAVLIGNISKTGNIKNLVVSILRIITDNLPQIINDTLAILEELIDGVIDGLIEWIDSDDGLAKMLKLIVQIQKVLEKVVSKALTKLVDMLDKHKDDFSKFLADSMASANRTLPVLLNAILRLIGILIEAIANAFSDENFVNSIIESIERSIDAIIEHIPRIITSIIKLIVNIISAIIPHLPELIMYVITEIAKALPSMAGQIASSLSSGIGKIFKSIFTVDFWMNSLKSFGTVLAELVKSALTMGIGSWGGSGSTTGSTAGDVALGIATGGISTLGHAFGWWANGTNNAPAGLSIVGEAGPELVKFRGGEQVLNNRNTNKALAEMGKATNNFNVTFNNLQDTTAFAMMNQLKAYNRQLAINALI